MAKPDNKRGFKMKLDYPRLAISIFLPLAAGFIGAYFTTASIATWYAALQKPLCSPPNWIFGPVWTVLYVLMGLSLYLVWTAGQNKEAKGAFALFGAQLGLNVLWSIIFFGLKSPFYAFVEIIVLWAAIALTIRSFRKISKTAAALLIPYIFWVSFAAVLNYSIWVLNP